MDAQSATPRIIAHRGDSAHAPENTLAALSLAASSCGWAECDVDILADGTVIVCHDSTLDRTTSGSGPYDHLTWEEVREVDAGGWFGPEFRGERLPRLGDVVDLANETGLCLNVELKSPRRGAQAARRLVAATAAELRRLNDGCEVIVSSFNHLMLRLMGEEGPWPLACLFDVGALGEDWRTIAELTGARIIHPAGTDLTADRVRAIRGAGFEVNVWTVNEARDAQTLATWGVSGIITDDPAGIAAAVAEV